MGIENRKYIRFDTSVKIKYKLTGSAWINGSSVCKDIATEGMRLIVSEKLPIGTPLDVEIYLPTEEIPIRLTGQVVWATELPRKEDSSRRFEAGVRFLNFISGDKNRFEGFLSKLNSA